MYTALVNTVNIVKSLTVIIIKSLYKKNNHVMDIFSVFYQSFVAFLNQIWD